MAVQNTKVKRCDKKQKTLLSFHAPTLYKNQRNVWPCKKCLSISRNDIKVSKKMLLKL